MDTWPSIITNIRCRQCGGEVSPDFTGVTDVRCTRCRLDEIFSYYSVKKTDMKNIRASGPYLWLPATHTGDASQETELEPPRNL